eukprot:1149920-Pelagomonas_calceolata.AAC.7
MRTLQLKNASATCGASWALEEMVTKDGGVPCHGCNEVVSERAHQAFGREAKGTQCANDSFLVTKEGAYTAMNAMKW